MVTADMLKQGLPIEVLPMLTKGTVECASIDSPVHINLIGCLLTYYLTSYGLIEVLEIAAWTCWL